MLAQGDRDIHGGAEIGLLGEVHVPPVLPQVFLALLDRLAGLVDRVGQALEFEVEQMPHLGQIAALLFFVSYFLVRQRSLRFGSTEIYLL
ncbi:hypothetical protein [Rhodococcus pyridinivorans]|uniref:hypothetical protein n=1 Tax=Rhodococcus pyridinivorans TaxID=103816 RepID=UPI001E5B085C|nr:hypothetical protein [Rhodococcus pyridinivorans]